MAIDTLTNHAQAALAKLASQFKDQDELAHLITALANRLQEVEDALQELLTERSLDTAVGAQLDGLGTIVGQEREGRADEPYRIAIRARVRLNIGSGTPEDIYATLIPTLSEGMTVRLEEFFPAGLLATVAGAIEGASASETALALAAARPAGVDAQLLYSESADDATFTFSDDNAEEASSTQGWADLLGHFVAAGASGKLAQSIDGGATWTQRTSGFTADEIKRVIWVDELGLFVAVGVAGKISTSPDGETWTARTSGVALNLLDVIYADGLLVACGSSDALVTSPDGVTWTVRTGGFGGSAVNSIAYGAGLFVIAGGGSGKIASSPDGVTWTLRTSGFASGSINHVIFADGLFVAVGSSGQLSTSADGITWALQTSDFAADEIQRVTHADGLFVAVGAVAKISTSPDGATWTARTSGHASGSFFDVAHAEGLFIAVGFSGRRSTSPDGVTWTPQDVGANVLRSIAHSQGTFVVVADGGEIITSPDASTWATPTSSFDTSNILTVCAGLPITPTGGGELADVLGA